MTGQMPAIHSLVVRPVRMALWQHCRHNPGGEKSPELTMIEGMEILVHDAA